MNNALNDKSSHNTNHANHTMSQKLSQQAFWFTIVGAMAALVHFLILVMLVNIWHIPPAWANVGAFLLAFLVSFSGHFYLTFRHDSTVKATSGTQPASALHKLGKWFASSVAGFALNQALFVLGLAWLGQSYYIVIWFLVTAIVTIMTFLLGKLWAFR
ncbi:GtrA family protein [Psychrobacter sp. I-STPA6b]|uniref:GtrA family protein n=1 Tax=Psychrobacter sp. I-STPA6b TaxID=2585718 RepID=UPI001D0C4C5C|nr:GtrA family protein [Psychrobacter sp. I-STPA6b]